MLSTVKKLLVASPSNFLGGALLTRLLKLSNERFLLFLFDRTTFQEAVFDSSAGLDSVTCWESLLVIFSSGSETDDEDAFCRRSDVLSSGPIGGQDVSPCCDGLLALLEAYCFSLAFELFFS